MSSQWARSGLAVGSQWARSGLAVGSQWARSGLSVGSQPARSELAACSRCARSCLAVCSQCALSGLAVGSQSARSGLAVGSQWGRSGLACEPTASALRAHCQPTASPLRAHCVPTVSTLRVNCDNTPNLLNQNQDEASYVKYLDKWLFYKDLAKCKEDNEFNTAINSKWKSCVKSNGRKLWELFDWNDESKNVNYDPINPKIINSDFTNIFLNKNIIGNPTIQDIIQAVNNYDIYIPVLVDDITMDEVNNAIEEIWTGAGIDGLDPSLTNIFTYKLKHSLVTFLNRIHGHMYPSSILLVAGKNKFSSLLQKKVTKEMILNYAVFCTKNI